MLENSDILALDRARLEDVDFPRLLSTISRSERTMVVRIANRTMIKQVIFENGVPVDCRSNMVHDTLSRFMRLRGLITRDQESALLKQAARTGLLFGEAAREAGLVDASGLFRLLQQNLAKKLLDLFTWSEGTIRLQRGRPDVDSPLKVNVPQLIHTGCCRFVAKQEIDFRVGHLVGNKICLSRDHHLDLARLQIPVTHRRLIELLSEPRGLTELSELAGLAFEEVARVVYSFLVMGLVVTEDELAEMAKSAPKTEIRQGRNLAEELPGDGSPVSADEVTSVYLRHRRVDASTLLEVPPSPSPSAIRQQFLQFSRRFAPWQFQEKSVKSQAEALFFAGVKAYWELMKPGTSGSEQVPKPQSEDSAEGLEVIRLAANELTDDPSKMVDAEQHFLHGLALRDDGNYTSALNELERAAECDPQNGRYRAEAAYAWYQCSPGTGARQALVQLEEAIRVDPQCGLAMFYFGELSAKVGEVDSAKRYLKQSIKLMAPDRRPIDLLKELAKSGGA